METRNEILAYLAGSMDADGHFGIRKSTPKEMIEHGMVNFAYFIRIGLKQVTPQVPELLKNTFGGHFSLTKSKHPNRRDMYVWNATCRQAVNACKSLLPFLRIKRHIVATILEFDNVKQNREMDDPIYWFVKENPDWQTDLISVQETTNILGYSNCPSTVQAIRNGTLLALNQDKYRSTDNCVSREFVQQRLLANNGALPRKHRLSPQKVAIFEEFFQKVKRMNRVGK